MSTDVTARKVEDFSALEQPGDYYFNRKDDIIDRITFKCSCGCRRITDLPIALVKAHKAWEWNGNEDLPTITPSIRQMSGCKWHGFLTAGVFKGACE